MRVGKNVTAPQLSSSSYYVTEPPYLIVCKENSTADDNHLGKSPSEIQHSHGLWRLAVVLTQPSSWRPTWCRNHFFLAMSRTRLERMAVMSPGARRNRLLPTPNRFRTSGDGSQQIRSFQKLVLLELFSSSLPSN